MTGVLLRRERQSSLHVHAVRKSQWGLAREDQEGLPRRAQVGAERRRRKMAKARADEAIGCQLRVPGLALSMRQIQSVCPCRRPAA